MLAVMLLLFPLPWILAAMLAALFHELCHWAAITLCCRESPPVSFFAFGARIPLPPMSRTKEAVCTLAGPLGSLVLLLFARVLPRTAVCAAFQSIYNLLPVYPMDGGRTLQCLLSAVLPPPTVEKVCKVIEGLCFTGLFLLGLYAWLRLQLGILPLALAVFVILRIYFSKTPCKSVVFRVQ